MNKIIRANILIIQRSR